MRAGFTKIKAAGGGGWAAFLLVLLGGSASAVTVTESGPFADPAHYPMGWSSAHAYGDCIYFLQGHATSGNPDNSVRCFRPATGDWTTVAPDTESAPGKMANQPPQAPNDRDNHVSLEIADEGILIAGGDGTGKEVHVEAAFFEYGRRDWSDVWVRKSQMEGSWLDGEWGDYKLFNAATAWSGQLDTGFIFGGNIEGPISQLLLIEPDGDGTYTAHEVADHGEGEWTDMRNNAVAVGRYVYIAGGRRPGEPGGADSVRFRRFDLREHTWETLPEVPVNTHFPQVTYDPGLNAIVYFGGTETPRWQPATRTLLIYDLDAGRWRNLTDRLDTIPLANMPTGAYHPETGKHCYRGGKWFDPGTGEQMVGYSNRVFCLSFQEKKGSETAWPGSGPSLASAEGSRGAIRRTAAAVARVSASKTTGSSPSVTSASGSEPVLPANTWVARRIDDNHKKHPVKSGKDMRWRYRPEDGKLYMCCGDWGAYEPKPASGHQEVFAYDVATDTWERAQDYCTGKAQPSGPDELGVAYDSRRDRLWVLPGMQWDHTERCPTAVLAETMTWDFTRNGPWEPTGHGILQKHDQTFARYDAVNDRIYITEYDGGKGSYIKIVNPETTEVERVYINHLGDIRVWRDHIAYSKERRALYLADTVKNDRYFRFDLDTHELTELAPLPIDADPNKWMQVYDREDGVVVAVHDSVGNTIHVYDPDADAWESRTLPARLPNGRQGTRVGNSIGYDPEQDTIVMLGRVGGGGGFDNIWLLRYDREEALSE